MRKIFAPLARAANRIGDIEVSGTTHMRVMVALTLAIAAAMSFLPGSDAPAQPRPEPAPSRTLF